MCAPITVKHAILPICDWWLRNESEVASVIDMNHFLPKAQRSLPL